ncbi:ribosomal protein L18e/L15P, partial [Gorgonomyces haynaldii]
LGRGGKGATAGRGRKGYGARSHKARPVPAFAGGQTSIVKAFRKYGHQQKQAIQEQQLRLRPLRLDQLQHWIDRGRIDPTKPITLKEIAETKVAGKLVDGCTLVGHGATALKQPVHLQVTRATPFAIEHIEKMGGSVTTVYSDKSIIHALLNPSRYAFIPKEFIPTDARLLRRYSDPVKRGFLANRVTGDKVKQLIEDVD